MNRLGLARTLFDNSFLKNAKKNMNLKSHCNMNRLSKFDVPPFDVTILTDLETVNTSVNEDFKLFSYIFAYMIHPRSHVIFTKFDKFTCNNVMRVFRKTRSSVNK